MRSGGRITGRRFAYTLPSEAGAKQ